MLLPSASVQAFVLLIDYNYTSGPSTLANVTAVVTLDDSILGTQPFFFDRSAFPAFLLDLEVTVSGADPSSNGAFEFIDFTGVSFLTNDVLPADPSLMTPSDFLDLNFHTGNDAGPANGVPGAIDFNTLMLGDNSTQVAISGITLIPEPTAVFLGFLSLPLALRRRRK
ncbi:MAG: hypothetical protein AAGH89_00330 [Verrucomicrobiota bacterium]